MSMAGKEQVRKLKDELEKMLNEIRDLQNVCIDHLNACRRTSMKIEAERMKIFPVRTNFKPRVVLRGHYGKVYDLHWQPEPKEAVQLVSASQDGSLIIWNGLTSKKCKKIALKESWVMGCAYSPGGRFVACSGLDNMCTIFPTDRDEHVHAELKGHEGYVSSCRFVNESKMLTSSGDSTCCLWDIERQTVITTFDSHSSDVMRVSITPDKKRFVSASCDTTAKVFEMGSGDCVGTYTGHTTDVNTVEWCTNGHTFASGSDDSTMKLFDERAYSQLNSYGDEAIESGVTDLCFSESGKFLFGTLDDSPYAVVYDTVTANIAQTLPNLCKRVSCVGLQSNGFAVCTGSWDYILRVFA